MRIIAICGPKTSGKDTAANYLLARNSVIGANLFQKVCFADHLKACCAHMFGFTDAQLNDMPFKEQPLEAWPFETPRFHMQNVAKIMRTMYGGDIWVRSWQRDLLTIQTQCVVNTDLRHTEELDALESLGAKIVYIKRKLAEEALQEGRARGDKTATDISEAMWDLLEQRADCVITNDGSIEELHSEIAEVTRKLVGDWTTWGPALKAEASA